MVENRVNGYQNNWQREPHIAALADGGWIIVYEGYFNNYDASDLNFTYVAAQRYNADGTLRGPETVISAIDDTVSSDASIAVLKDGGYVVTWSYAADDDIFTNGARTRAQVFNADGSARSAVVTAASRLLSRDWMVAGRVVGVWPAGPSPTRASRASRRVSRSVRSAALIDPSA